jgi:hypothetical protein
MCHAAHRVAAIGRSWCLAGACPFDASAKADLSSRLSSTVTFTRRFLARVIVCAISLCA